MEGADGPPLLEVRGLNAFYGTSQVVFDIDLDVSGGEIVTVLGRNGAGKTSALMAIAGTVRSSAATVRVEGNEISRMQVHRRVRAGLSLVPSGARVFPDLTVAENLGMVKPRPEATGWDIDDVYAAFPPLERLKGSLGGKLSGGERQMLAVGRAMLARPRVLMLDEPSEGLGPRVVEQLGLILTRLSSEGLAILLTEQNHRFALQCADRAGFIEKGHLVWEGDAETAAAPDVVDRYLAL